MPSIKSKFFNAVIRNRHLLQGKLQKERFDDNTSIQAFRDQCEKSAARMAKIPAGVDIRKDSLNGINCEWIIPGGADTGKVIMYVHGGGYVSGSCDDHRGFVSKFAKSCGYQTLQFDYRLAPEHPFPAALEDSVKVYEALLKTGIKPGNILIAGESAGGGLVLATLLALKQNSIPMPAAAVAISPWTDLTCSSASYRTKNLVSVAPLDSWLVFSRHYVGQNCADNPLISPLFGDLEGLPPIFINSGDYDELFDDGERFSQKAKQAGVDVTFRAGEGQIHCYPLLSPMFPEATDALDEICAVIQKYLQ